MVDFDWGIRISIKIQLKLMCIWIIYKWFISLLITNFRWLNHPSVHEFQFIIHRRQCRFGIQYSNYMYILTIPSRYRENAFEMQMQMWYVKSNELQSFDDLETSLNRHQSKILTQCCCCYCGLLFEVHMFYIVCFIFISEPHYMLLLRLKVIILWA